MEKKMILPVIKKYWKLLLSTLIVTALGCAMMMGLSSAHKSLENTLESYVDDYNYPDAQIVTEVTNSKKIEELNKIEGIKEINTRLVLDTIMISPSGKYLSTRVFSYNDEDFQKMHVWSSIDNNEENSIMLEHNFAEDNNIKVGDKVKFKIEEEYREYTVSKIISLPEALSTKITDKSWGANSDFGYVYASANLLKQETNKEKEEAREKLQENISQVDSKEDDAQKQHREYEEQIVDAENQLETEKKNFNEIKVNINQQINQLSNLNNELQSAREELTNKADEANEASEVLPNVIEELDKTESKLVEAKTTLKKIDTSIEEVNSEYEQLTSNEIKGSIEIIKLISEDTTMQRVYDVCDKIQEFLNLLDEYEIELDIDGTIHDTAERLDSFTDTVQEDYEYLHQDSTKQLVNDIKNNKDGVKETEEYRKLVKVIRRYNKLSNINHIERAYEIAEKRNAKLNTYTENNKVFVAASVVHDLGREVTVKQVLTNIDESKDMSDQIEEITGCEEINTVGDFIEAYNSVESTTQQTINELTEARNNITNTLSSQGIEEENLDNVILEVKGQKEEAQENLRRIQENIPEINKGIIEIENNINESNEGIVKLNNTLKSGEKQIQNAEKELNAKKEQLSSTWIDTVKQFTDAREELKKAYEDIENKDGYEQFFNQILIKVDENTDPEEILKKAVNTLEGIKIKNSYTYENSAVKNRIDINLEPIETMSTFMPIVFFIIILIVVFLFMSLIIKQSRREIGILRALGFEKNQIRLIFCIINLIVSVLAIILGTIIGVALMLYVGNYYKNFFPIPFFEYAINWKMYIISILCTIIIGQIATITSSISIEKVEPIEAMSRTTPTNSKVPNFVKVMTQKAKPFTKFSVISLLRNKVKFILSVLCISASVMMIFSALSFITSKNYILNELYNERIKYDAQIFLKDYPDEELIKELNSIQGVSNIEIVDYYDAIISANGKEEEVLINAMPIDTKLVGIYDTDGKKLEIPEKGIILEKHIADNLGVKNGDFININNVSIEIKEISEQSINRIQYISSSQAKEIGKSDFETILLNMPDNVDQELLAKLSEKDEYLYTVFTKLSYASNAKIFATYDIAAWIIIAFAIVIGLVIVINTTFTNLLEQKKKLCMLRVLGFQHSQISKNWFIQSILQFIIACIIGLPIGIGIAQTALFKLSTADREYVFANGIKEYIITILLVFAYMVISHIVSMKSLKHWNITETVKEKE